MNRDPRLGRGLAALLGEAAKPVRQNQEGVRSVPLDLLEPGPFQPRTQFPEAGLQELAASIRARGILQPLLVRSHPADAGRFQLVAGERRWRAAALAGLHEAPVLVRELSDSDALAAALVENLQRQDLNPLEEAEGYKRLIEEYGLTQEQLAEAIGKSRGHIANVLRVLNASPRVREALRAGTITLGHARALMAVPDPDHAVQAVIANQLSVRETEALAAGRPERRERDAAARDPDLEAYQRELSRALGLRVEITGSYAKGTVRIAYSGLDQLEAVVAKLTS